MFGCYKSSTADCHSLRSNYRFCGLLAGEHRGCGPWQASPVETLRHAPKRERTTENGRVVAELDVKHLEDPT
jgi:hypothetical protein